MKPEMTLYEFTSAKIALRRKMQLAVNEALQEFYDTTGIQAEGKIEFCFKPNDGEFHQGEGFHPYNVIEYITHIEG